MYLPSIRQGKVKLTIGTFNDPYYDDDNMFEILAVVDVESRRDDFTLDSEKLYKKLNISDDHEKLSGYDDRHDNIEDTVDEIYEYFISLDQDDIDETLIELADDFDANRVKQMFGPVDESLKESLLDEHEYSDIEWAINKALRERPVTDINRTDIDADDEEVIITPTSFEEFTKVHLRKVDMALKRHDYCFNISGCEYEFEDPFIGSDKNIHIPYFVDDDIDESVNKTVGKSTIKLVKEANVFRFVKYKNK